jgi:protein TonB
MTVEGERFDRWVVASVFFHAALFAFVIFSPKLFPNLAPNWGGSAASGPSAISAKIVSNVSSGVPLPTPEVVNETAPANDSPGLSKSEPEPPPVPEKEAEPVPLATAPKATPKPKPAKPAPPAPKAPPVVEKPSNTVPYGEGGRPALSYGQFSTGAGQAGIGFGDSSFGDRFSSYVNQIQRAISNNWLKSMVDSNVQHAPRVYMTFDIARDGTISGISVKQSSNIPSLDRSAQRAILASNPLPPLPSDYRGGSINVVFYFEYSR